MGRKRDAEIKYMCFITIFSLICFVVTTFITSQKRQKLKEEQVKIYRVIQAQTSTRSRNNQRNTSIKATRVEDKHRQWFSQSLSVQIDTIKAMDIKKRVISSGMSWKKMLSNSVEIVKEFNGKLYRKNESQKKLRMKAVENCAIVGNGGVLLDSRCGDEINAHDFVFRINMAPIDGFRTDVGSRVDFMALNSQGTRQLLGCMKRSTQGCTQTLRTLSMLEKGYLWFSKYTTVNLKLSSAIYEYVNTTIFVFPFRLWNTSGYPSSGLFVYSLASTMCKRISLYGFYPFKQTNDGSRLTYNYYTDIGIDEFEIGHDMPNEYELLQALHNQRILRLVTDPCPPIEKYEVRNRKHKRRTEY
ncbi:CMP-N-acetylneuraminate-poly-alpha-2,8-sialyltransferase-like [Anneissia japonica]|uniref:CMP-N-acetylneuraminate-poly-alpha-2, 8-sialyltransferase-like n=1 Tax=Anneissia japonica TaxID=1529436 RepID=UPI001425800B|nr:CMP-N-acetylneuraminate-poly-alpha-2,8-sialyltransferase-like [Anneissia japonica]